MRMSSVRAWLVIVGVVGCGPSSSSGLFPYLRPAGGRDAGTTFAAMDRALVQTIARSQATRAERTAGPPISLTTSDGAGLVLARVEVDAVVAGPLALTELHLTFRNPEARVREGRFAITLPPDAAVSRFAMKNEDWREAEVVARMRARQVYETFLKQRVDPALLEQGAGNQFTARVFPIAASADKELIVSYSQEVSAATPYQVPLAGLPAIGELRWSITVDGATHAGEQHDQVPGDLHGSDSGVSARADVALIAGDAFVARVVPPVAATRDPLGSAVVLVDTSGSTASILQRQAMAAGAVVTAIAISDPAAPVEVRAFDQTIEPLARGAAGAIEVDRLVEAIVARGGLGASDLGLAIGSLGDDAGRRLILISDGIATVGEREAGALAERLRVAKLARVDAVVVGGARDQALLSALAGAGERGGTVVDGDDPQALRGLERTVLGDVAISVAGATRIWPYDLRAVVAGQPVVVYGHRLGDPRAPLTIRFHVGTDIRVATVTPVPGPAPLVARAVGRAEVARLTHELDSGAPGGREQTRIEIERLGLEHRLVTRETSLLVLETDEDYARFCIDRNRLHDLMTVRAGAIAVLDRGPGASPPKACRDERPPPPASIGTASLTTSATTGAVAGVIRDRQTREPLIGATVVVEMNGHSEAAITDEQGWYGIGGLPAGVAALTIYYDDATNARRITIPVGQVLDLGGARGASAVANARPPAPSGTLDDELTVITGGHDRPRAATPPTTGATITEDYTVNIPTGRSFGAVYGTAAGSQGDTFAGSSSTENTYVVDGINLDVRDRGGEMIEISSSAPMIDPTSTAQGITIADASRFDHPRSAFDHGFRESVDAAAPEPPPPPPYEGRLLTVMQHLQGGRRAPALREALRWYLAEPTDLAAILALGEALEAGGAIGLAARAYGTILDRFPDRVELIRYAGERLDRLGPAGRARALDAYQQAVADRPDHATGYRLLAMAQVRSGDLDGALDSLERGLGHAASDGIRTIFRGDLGLVGAALAAREPTRRATLAARLQRRGATIADGPSVRFVLHWETDTNDVDLHVRDRAGHHAFYQDKKLASGGELLEDVTTGYGPEAFVIRGVAGAGPYRLATLYFARGAMGLGLGTVQVVVHDGAGKLTIDDRPFVLQVDHAEVDLGSYQP